jgi:hypothetical protein
VGLDREAGAKVHQVVFHNPRENLRHREGIPGTWLEWIIDADDIPDMEAEMLAELYNNTGNSFQAFIHGRKNSGIRFVVNPLGALPQLPAPEDAALVNFD